MKILLIAALLVLSTAALYAQQSQPTVQEQLYTACGNTNTQLAKMIDTANVQITASQQQVAKLTAELKTMKDKYEPEKKPDEKK